MTISERSNPLISIVTPSFNQGRFIRETIQSVLSQSYPHIDYWVMDGGSSDNTCEILMSFEGDSRFHWISEKDDGQSDAINKGILRCRGEIFSWLNSDDVLLPDTLQRIASKWSTSGPCVIYGLARYIDQNGNDLGRCDTQSPIMTRSKLLRFGDHPKQPATFASLEHIRAVGGVDTSLHFSMDIDLWIKLAQHLPIHHINRDVALYRLHPDSKTVSAALGFSKDAQRILDRAVEQGLISVQQSKVTHNLFTARLLMSPEVGQFDKAITKLKEAIQTDKRSLPIATAIFLRYVTRKFVGESIWSVVRNVKSRVA